MRFYSNLGYTNLCSRNTLTLHEVYEDFHSKEKMKQMVSYDESINSQIEGLYVQVRSNEWDSQRENSGFMTWGKDKSCQYYKKDGQENSECYELTIKKRGMR